MSTEGIGNLNPKCSETKLRAAVLELKLQLQCFLCCMTLVQPVTLSVLLSGRVEKKGLNRQGAMSRLLGDLNQRSQSMSGRADPAPGELGLAGSPGLAGRKHGDKTI